MHYSNRQHVRALAALLSALPCIAAAATLTWDGNGSADTGGNWSVPANWTTDVSPTTADTAVLDNVTAGVRTINYDTSASGALTALTFNQGTAGATNLLNLQRSLTVADAITLGAAAGTEQIGVAPASGTSTLTATGGLTLESNGVLALSAGNGFFGNFAGALTLSGGSLVVAGSPHTGSVTSTVNGNLTMTSGAISIENNGSAGQTQADRRLTITGNVNISGGTISSTRSGTSGMLTLSGASLTFNPASFDPDLTLTLDRNGAQALTSNQALTGTLLFRGTGEKTLTRTDGGTVGALTFIDSSASSSIGTTLKLGSDLTLNTGAAQPNAVSFSQTIDSNSAIQLGIDSNGHTLNLASGAGGGVWTPNKSAQVSVTTTVWTLSNSGAATGGIQAAAFNFNSTGVTVDVDSGVSLQATGGNGTATHLGSSGAFAADASFVYAGAAVAGTPATLSSGRSIGALIVDSGALRITGSAFTAAGGVTVKTGASLDFSSQTVATTSLTMEVTGAAAGQITALDSYVFSGDLFIDFSSTATAGDLLDLFQFTTTHGDTASFSSVALTGAHSTSLFLEDGVWSGSVDGLNFAFDQGSGDLSVTSAIPEPSAYAVLAGFGALGLAAFLRRRRA